MTTTTVDNPTHRPDLRIVVPYHTCHDPWTPRGREEPCYLITDAGIADHTVTAIYHVDDAQEAAPLLAAAEILGFATSYHNDHNENGYAYVMIYALAVSAGVPLPPDPEAQ